MQLSRQHHPDKNGGLTSETFIQIDKAWKVLSDERKRSVYDAEQANAKLEREQDAAIWQTLQLCELEIDQTDTYSLTCRCGGQYQIELEEVVELREREELEVLLDCDTCSLNILLTF